VLTRDRNNMNKQKTRYTPFEEPYRMRVEDFCDMYGLDIKVIMHRMNVLFWEDFDALVIPQNVGDTSADRIRRTLTLLEQGWDYKAIQARMNISEEIVRNIQEMDDYLKQIFMEMDHYFFLNPKKIDVSKIFKERNKCAEALE